MHKTLNNISRGPLKCSQNVSFFFEGGACVRRRGGGACAMAQWHNGTMACRWAQMSPSLSSIWDGSLRQLTYTGAWRINAW